MFIMTAQNAIQVKRSAIRDQIKTFRKQSFTGLMTVKDS
jgi:hypothetical protein